MNNTTLGTTASTMRMLIYALTLTIATIAPSIASAEDVVLDYAFKRGVAYGNFNGDAAIDGEGNLYTYRWVYGIQDADPGPAEYLTGIDGKYTLMFRKFNAQGRFEWARMISTYDLNRNRLEKMLVSKNGDLYLSFELSEPVDLDPGLEEYSIGPNPGPDPNLIRQVSVLCKWNSSGEFVWAKKIDGTGFSSHADTQIDSLGNVYILSFFVGTLDFNPGPDTYEITAGGYAEIFLCKLNGQGEFEWVVLYDYYDYFTAIQGFSVDPTGRVFFYGELDAYEIPYQGYDVDPGPEEHLLSPFYNVQECFWMLEPDGSLAWAKLAWREYTNNYVQQIRYDQNNVMHMAKVMEAGQDADLGPDVYRVPRDGTYILQYDAQMNFLGLVEIGGRGYGFHMDREGNY